MSGLANKFDLEIFWCVKSMFAHDDLAIQDDHNFIIWRYSNQFPFLFVKDLDFVYVLFSENVLFDPLEEWEHVEVLAQES